MGKEECDILRVSKSERYEGDHSMVTDLWCSGNSSSKAACAGEHGQT